MNTKPTFKDLIELHTLSAFFILAFGLTWLFMVTDALGSQGMIPFRLPIPLLVVAGYMPTLAAVLVTVWTKGKSGVKALFSKLLIARVGVGWYLFSIFGMVGVYILAILANNAFGPGPDLPIISTKAPQVPVWQLALMVIPMFVVIGLVNGEELAWRGFAMPRL
jgi:membrane protease YdiL (CAAX protease family)